MNLNIVKKNMYALFMAMTVSASSYAAEKDLDEHKPALRAWRSSRYAVSNNHHGHEPAVRAWILSRDKFLSALLSKNLTKMGEILDEHPNIVNSLLNTEFSRETDFIKEFPLHIAVRFEDTDVARFLIDRGANVNQSNRYKMSPLHLASKHLDMITLLLDRGARVNHMDSQERTVLHYASMGGRLDCVELLLKRGADSTLKDGFGESALDMAKTLETTALLKKEELWRKRVAPLWMASDFASPNLLKCMPQDVARYIISRL